MREALVQRHPDHVNVTVRGTDEGDRTYPALRVAGGLCVIAMDSVRMHSQEEHGRVLTDEIVSAFFVITETGVPEGFRSDTVHEALCYANKLAHYWPHWSEIGPAPSGRGIVGRLHEARAASRWVRRDWRERGSWLGEDWQPA